MSGRRIWSAATALVAATIALAPASSGDEPGNHAPVVTVVQAGNPGSAIFDVTDADGAADILGISYGFTSNRGTISSPLGITLTLIKRGAIKVTDIAGGKRVTINAVPPGITKVSAIAFDSCFTSASATTNAPPAYSRGKP